MVDYVKATEGSDNKALGVDEHTPSLWRAIERGFPHVLRDTAAISITGQAVRPKWVTDRIAPILKPGKKRKNI